MSLTDPEYLVYPYTRFYRLAQHFAPDLTRTLMIGGGGYSYPKDFLKTFKTATMDVVEIDPAVTQLARDHFALLPDKRLSITHEDGRTFLQKSDSGIYDVVFGDAFSSYYSIPHQLTTQEAAQQMHRILSPTGIAIINTVSSLEGDKSKFFRAEYLTLKSVFAHVYAFPVFTEDLDAVQNIMLIAFKDAKEPNLKSSNPEFQEYLSTQLLSTIPADLPILTDDFAPVDQYIAALPE